MKHLFMMLAGLLVMAGLTGCGHPVKKSHKLFLGMTPEQVQDEFGKPYAIRSAKVFDNEETTMIYEYWPPFFSTNEMILHLHFENSRLVQWGAAGDYNTGSESKVQEYKEQKK